MTMTSRTIPFISSELTRADQQLFTSLKRKRNRLEQKLFLVEGIKNIRELLASNFLVERLIIPENFPLTIHFPNLPANIKISTTTGSRFSSLCETVSPEGILAVAHFRKSTWHIPSPPSPLVYLDGISDPGNLGAILRTLDWFGFPQVIMSHDTTDPYNGKTVRSSMGSLFFISFFKDTPERSRLHELMEENYSIYPLTLDGKRDIQDIRFPEQSVVVMGSESHGVRPDVLALMDESIRIPGWGHAESLNVAHAFSIAAFQLRMNNPDIRTPHV